MKSNLEYCINTLSEMRDDSTAKIAEYDSAIWSMKNELEIVLAHLTTADGLCPVCGEDYFANETILDNGELGCKICYQ